MHKAEHHRGFLRNFIVTECQQENKYSVIMISIWKVLKQQLHIDLELLEILLHQEFLIYEISLS